MATKSPIPRAAATNCFITDPGYTLAVIARLKVERKNAMVSISKPFLLRALMAKT